MTSPKNIIILTDAGSWMNKFNSLLKEKLEKLGCQVHLVSRKEEIREGDIAFFLSCSSIVEKDILLLNHNNIVVHASDLPHGKGFSPMSWQILEGKNDFTLTLFEADEACDSGDIYIQDKLELSGYELCSEWQEILGMKIVSMCLDFVHEYPKILERARKQSGDESIYPRRYPKDSELDPDKTIREQFNLLRIVDNENYPAFFLIDGHKYKLKIEKY